MNDSQRKVVLDWMRKIHKMEYAHRYQSMNWKRANYWLGIPTLVVATTIGALATITSIPKELVDVAVPLGAIIVAILSGLQTFLKPTEKEGEFKDKSDEFEELRHRTEEFLEFHKEDQSEKNITDMLGEIRNSWAKIGNLNISNTNMLKADEKLKRLKKYPEPLGFLEDYVKEGNGKNKPN